MEIGFETIGNATLVCHDRIPVLVTDPWLTGGAYFGSWGLSNAIPEETMASIKQCPYVWISHGHPDHLSPRSLELLAGKEILLADHVGGIIRQGLSERGFQVRVLKDREWTPLSERVRIMSIADYNQDGILLVEMNGRLIVDLNDADRPDGILGRASSYQLSFATTLSVIPWRRLIPPLTGRSLLLPNILATVGTNRWLLKTRS